MSSVGRIGSISVLLSDWVRLSALFRMNRRMGPGGGRLLAVEGDQKAAHTVVSGDLVKQAGQPHDREAMLRPALDLGRTREDAALTTAVNSTTSRSVKYPLNLSNVASSTSTFLVISSA